MLFSSMTSLSSSLASTFVVLPKVKPGPRNDDQLYVEARAAVQTANQILGKIRMGEEQALDRAVKWLHNNENTQDTLWMLLKLDQSEFYESFCDVDEARTIKSCYVAFCRGQKKNLDKINYFRNYPKQVDIQTLKILLPQSQITCLNLMKNSIGDADMCTLAQVLPQTRITSLNLEDNRIGDAGVYSLAQVLPKTQIIHLILKGNRAVGAYESPIALFDQTKSREGVDALIKVVAEMRFKGKTINVLGLDERQITAIVLEYERKEATRKEAEARRVLEELNGRIQLITQQIQSNTLRVVDLFNFKIPENFSPTKKTTEIRLRPIITHDIKSLLQALKSNTSAMKLNLSQNPKIGDEVIDLLAEIYTPRTFSKGNTTLLSIDLQGTSITPQGFDRLESAFRKQKVKINLLHDFRVKMQEEEILRQKAAKLKEQREKQAQEKAQKEAEERAKREQVKKVDKKKAESKTDSSSSSSSTSASTFPVVVEPQQIDWRNKAQSECSDYEQFYGEICAAVLTANRILGGKVKTEKNRAEYLAVKYLQDHPKCSLSEVYQSFCEPSEVQTIINSYTSFCHKQNNDLYKICYFRNTPKKLSVKTLCSILPQSHITWLNLEYNAMGDTRVHSLAQVLAHTPITSLDLWANSIGVAGMQSLAQELPHTRITSLNLGVNSIGTNGVHSLASVLNSTQITSLDLYNNAIGETGVRILVRGLTHITRLNLGSNSIGDRGVASLAEVLPQTQIISLCLRCNNIGEVGANSLGQVLALTRITHLDVGYNSIGATGVQSLTQRLSQAKVTRLDLNHNLIGNEGAYGLARVLADTQIARLDLCDNSIEATKANDLLETIARMRLKGRSIIVSGVNGIDEKKISETVKRLNLSELERRRHQEVVEKSRKESAEKAKNEKRAEAITDSSAFKSLRAEIEMQKTIVDRLQEISLKQRKELEKLRTVQMNAQELEQMINKQQELERKEVEIQFIKSRDALNDFYFAFLIMLTDCITACKAIHAKGGPAQAANSQKDWDDYIRICGEAIGEGADLIGSAIPLPSLLIKVLTGPLKIVTKTHELLSLRNKLLKINQIVRFFPMVTEGDIWAEALARKLTFAQEKKLRALPTEQVGFIRRAINSCKDVKCWLMADDTNNAIRRLAAEQCETLITHIIDGKFQPQAQLNDIPAIVVMLSGQSQSTPVLDTVSNVYSSSASGAISLVSAVSSSAVIPQTLSVQSSTLISSVSSSSSLSSSSPLAQSSSSTSSSAMTFQTRSTEVNQDDERVLTRRDWIEMQEAVRQTKKLAERAANKSSEALEQAVKNSGISVGGNSVQAFAVSNAHQNPDREAQLAAQVNVLTRQVTYMYAVFEANNMHLPEELSESEQELNMKEDLLRGRVQSVYVPSKPYLNITDFFSDKALKRRLEPLDNSMKTS